MAADSAVGYPFESAEGGTWWVHAARQVGLPSERAEYFPLLGLTLLILLHRTRAEWEDCARLWRAWYRSPPARGLIGRRATIAIRWPALSRDWPAHVNHPQPLLIRGPSPPIPDRKRGEMVRFGQRLDVRRALALPPVLLLAPRTSFPFSFDSAPASPYKPPPHPCPPRPHLHTHLLFSSSPHHTNDLALLRTRTQTRLPQEAGCSRRCYTRCSSPSLCLRISRCRTLSASDRSVFSIPCSFEKPDQSILTSFLCSTRDRPSYIQRRVDGVQGP